MGQDKHGITQFKHFTMIAKEGGAVVVSGKVGSKIPIDTGLERT